MGGGHEGAHVGAERLAQEQVAAADGVDLVAVGPDLVGGAREAVAAAGGAAARLLGFAVAVQAEDGAEGAPLEPAHEELAECRGARVPAVEAADVRRPPRDAGEAGVQAGGELGAEAGPGAGDVAGPLRGVVLVAGVLGGGR